ncbi:esterase-like activity of phytase family protein [Aestuariivirga sp.]|uniref:esterase-like activity of phytase family protein n=1 Tax=Aestuariivirga sp. TaxID=2650926 RepID=UPI0035931B06
MSGDAAGKSRLEVTATQISSFNTIGIGTEFGPFAWRGGLTLTGNTDDFGGLSGITLGMNCEELLSVSDRGNWFQARLSYENGQLAGVSEPRMTPVLDSKGKPQRNKSWADAEALAPLGNGKIGVAYERKVRFGAYDFASKGTSASFEVIVHPAEIDQGKENGEVESFGLLPTGRYIAIAERQRDTNGNIRAWIWRDKDALAFSIARYGSYNVTDLAVLPDGTILTMERSFTRRSLPGMVIRHFDPKDAKQAGTIHPTLLLEASVPFYAIDNMEGIAVCDRDGETRVTLQSDDNFNAGIQSTILLQFAYRPN